jgi:hypothetical protein
MAINCQKETEHGQFQQRLTINHDGLRSRNLLPTTMDFETPPHLDYFSKNTHDTNSHSIIQASYLVEYLICARFLVCK